MKEIKSYILQRLAIAVCCLYVLVQPFNSYAQVDGDSLVLYSDSLTTVHSDSSTAVYSNDNNEEGKKEYSDEVVFRSVPDSTVARLKRERAFAYANDPAYWVKQKKAYRKGFWDYMFDFLGSREARFIFYTLLIALAVFVIYRIIVVNDLLGMQASKKSRKLQDETVAIEVDRNTLDEKIQACITEKNFPMAVRYLYLKTLYMLSDKQWIHFHPEATNKHYLNQMSAHERSEDFRFLTRVYEYLWYGKFEITEEQFSVVHSSFKNFHVSI